MKPLAPTLLLIAGLLALAACGGGPHEGAAPSAGAHAGNVNPSATAGPEKAKGTVYGSPADSGAVLAIADIVARSKELDGKQVRIEGTVTDVCAKRGCWIEIADDSSDAPITFKVEDGVMVFPMDANGKHVVADGIVRRTELTLEETREEMASEAADAGTAFDPASVTEPRVYLRIDGIGARISNPA